MVLIPTRWTDILRLSDRTFAGRRIHGPRQLAMGECSCRRTAAFRKKSNAYYKPPQCFYINLYVSMFMSQRARVARFLVLSSAVEIRCILRGPAYRPVGALTILAIVFIVRLIASLSRANLQSLG